MIVRCVRSVFPSDDPEASQWYPDLTVGKEYRVLAIEGDAFRLQGDEGRPFVYPARAFETIDPTPGPDWVRLHGQDEEVHAGPAELLRPGLFEDYFDGDPDARKIVARYLRER